LRGFLKITLYERGSGINVTASLPDIDVFDKLGILLTVVNLLEIPLERASKYLDTAYVIATMKGRTVTDLSGFVELMKDFEFDSEL